MFSSSGLHFGVVHDLLEFTQYRTFRLRQEANHRLRSSLVMPLQLYTSAVSNHGALL